MAFRFDAHTVAMVAVRTLVSSTVRARPRGAATATARRRVVPVRVPLAVGAARAAARLTGLVHHRGTAIPGLVAQKIWPEALVSLGAQLERTIVVVGTNGKTTTAGLISHILGHDRALPIANRSGANLRQGLVSTLVSASDLHGRIGHSNDAGRDGVFEVDELALEQVLPDLGPTVIVATNLFRDQLDRYGEADVIVAHWAAAFEHAAPGSRFVYCADDPRLAMLAASIEMPTVTFGLKDPPPDRHGTDALGAATIDPIACRTCGRPLVYGWRSVGHLGDFQCPEHHIRRARPDIAVVPLGPVDRHGLMGDGPAGMPTVRIETATGSAVSRPRLDGLPNAYNVAAAVAAAAALGMDPLEAAAALDGAGGAFGRLERVAVGDRVLVLVLVKNTVSLDETTRLGPILDADVTLLALNDAPADGRDVSWIWDAPIAPLVADRLVVLTGTRAEDLALRLKYDPAVTRDPPRSVRTEGKLEAALDAALSQTPPGGTVVAVATYTAMMGLRAIAEARGGVAPIPR